MRLILYRAQVPQEIPHHILNIPITDEARSLATDVNSYLQMLVDQARTNFQTDEDVVPENHKLTVKMEPRDLEEDDDEKQSEIVDFTKVSQRPYPRLVTYTPVWDTQGSETLPFINYLKDHTPEDSLLKQILENIPRYVAISANSIATTVANAARDEISLILDQPVPTLHSTSVQAACTLVHALDENHVLYDTRFNNMMKNSLMDQLQEGGRMGMDDQEYHDWKTEWYRESTLAQGTLNTRMTKIRIDELCAQQDDAEDMHSDHEQHLLEDISTLQMPHQEHRMCPIVSDSSENNSQHATFIQNVDGKRRRIQ